MLADFHAFGISLSLKLKLKRYIMLLIWSGTEAASSFNLFIVDNETSSHFIPKKFTFFCSNRPLLSPLVLRNLGDPDGVMKYFSDTFIPNYLNLTLMSIMFGDSLSAFVLGA
ncbi:hypothetical protein BpHYR1_024808 [Brachionus plicatilis]|uniref:Uncharacterized protein n=1 Tax=Brachionus plicatilis TaxID=10195 RepID=A0A3M7RYH6_BRAPC|nr:hypothetical protein BpHYR1_024808 [Brachionus plicatilis]